MIYNYLPAYISGKNMLPGFKGGFDSFANGVGRAIYNEMVANGWYTPARYDNIMSLLSSESGHGTSMLATKYHNYGGRKNAKGGYMHFKDDSAFAKDHLAYLQRMHRAAWNAKDTMDYVKALKASNYMGDNIYHYYQLLKGQLSARRAWNAAMKTWGLPKEPVDATRVALPVLKVVNTQLHLPTPVARPEVLPTTYVDPSIFMEYPEEILLPLVEDNLYALSVLPDVSGVMRSLLLSNGIYAPDETNFISGLDLPGAKEGKDILPGFELGTPPPEKTLNQKAMEQYEYLKRHPFLANMKNNIKKLKNGYNEFWNSNLYRFPAYLALGAVSGNVTGNALLRGRTAVRAAGRTKVPTAKGKTTYVVSPENEILGDLLGVYGLFLKTPIGALLPFKYGKDSGIHIKPSHRGRFTRYLKSHPGMTAEKAKHSKSAAVRKMATFAINARKWRH